MKHIHRALAGFIVCSALSVGLGGCTTPAPQKKPRTAEDVHASLLRMIPPRVADRTGWANDIQAAFQALDLPPSNTNLCAAIAVIEQESTFSADPPVPNLGKIAREEIERRAARFGIPRLAVAAALLIKAPDGRPYGEHLAAVRTERELSNLFDEIVARAPLGRTLLERANPVRTGGPMQVSTDYAQAFVRERPYPYAMNGSVRSEVFTRRGGLYFGIAHLLKYPNNYARHLYRFADFNAGHYASRNAAFQAAVAIAANTTLDLDGDLVNPGSTTGATEAAVLKLGTSLGMDAQAVHAALLEGSGPDFERNSLYQLVFAMAEKKTGKPLPRAVLPHIQLESPKITRRLSTEWFANSVERRYRACEARVGA